MKKRVTKKQIEALLDPAVTASHERTLRLLADRIAYHERKLREERALRAQ